MHRKKCVWRSGFPSIRSLSDWPVSKQRPKPTAKITQHSEPERRDLLDATPRLMLMALSAPWSGRAFFTPRYDKIRAITTRAPEALARGFCTHSPGLFAARATTESGRSPIRRSLATLLHLASP